MTMVAIARDVLPADEVAEVDGMDRDEVERALADELREMKDHNPAAFDSLLRLLPAANRRYIEDVASRYSL
jgi:hypothetical protein